MSLNPSIHATAIACRGPDGWRCALLQGPSGSGKSDLALRLLDRGWRLVSDDQVHVWRSGDAIYATAPRQILGRIEARGLGIVTVADLYVSRVVRVVDCVQQATERMPEDNQVTLCGVLLPQLTLDIRPQSAVETLIRAMAGLEP